MRCKHCDRIIKNEGKGWYHPWSTMIFDHNPEPVGGVVAVWDTEEL